MIKESIRQDGIFAKQSSVESKKAKTVNYRLGEKVFAKRHRKNSS